MNTLFLLFTLLSQAPHTACPDVNWSMIGQPQQLDQDCLIKLLSRSWKIIKTNINGVYVPQERNFPQDSFHFFEDMTFERIEDGIKEVGSWTYDEEHNQIVLRFEKTPGEQHMTIERADREHLVLRQEADWRHNMTIYLISEEVEQPCTS